MKGIAPVAGFQPLVGILVAVSTLALFGTANAQTYSVTEFPTPEFTQAPLVYAPDGNLYGIKTHVVSLSGSGTYTYSLDQFSTTGAATNIAMNPGSLWANQTGNHPSMFGVGPDGWLWIGRTPASGPTVFYKFNLSGASQGSFTPTVYPELFDRDGQYWYVTDYVSGQVGRKTLAGVTTLVPSAATAVPYGNIVLGRDGNIWFASRSLNTVGYITPMGVKTSFSIPTASSEPAMMGVGPDGNMWFAEQTQGVKKVGKVTPSGVITEYVVNSPGYVLIPNFTPGPDGNIWFADFDDVVRITPSGSVAVADVPTASADPQSLNVGSDGRIWFGEQFATLGVVNGIPVNAATNDNFASATVLTGSSGFINTNNLSATAEAGEPSNAGNVASRSLWYRFTPSTSGQVLLSTHGSTYETVIGVYTGNAVSSLTRVVDASLRGIGMSWVAFYAQAGTTYNIAVDGFSGERGVQLLDWRLNTAPSSDLTLAMAAATGGEPGSNFNYTMTIGNVGPDYATNLRGTLTLPPSVNFVSASAGCSYNSGTRVVTCTKSLFTTSGLTTTFTITAVSTVEGTTQATGNVVADGTDPNPANNTTTFTAVVQHDINGDAPLPAWALFTLGAGLLGAIKRRGKNGHAG